MKNYIVEFIGTFIFLSVILTKPEPIPIAIALAAAIFFGAAVSGAHYNPAVSMMMAMDGRSPMVEMGCYVIAQIAGAAAALFFYNKFMKKSLP